MLGLSALVVSLAMAPIALGGDINRQSIVFHEETPDVFYCPQDKPVSLEGMIVKARPLKALCQYQGRPLPGKPEHSFKLRKGTRLLLVLGFPFTVKSKD